MPAKDSELQGLERADAEQKEDAASVEHAKADNTQAASENQSLFRQKLLVDTEVLAPKPNWKGLEAALNAQLKPPMVSNITAKPSQVRKLNHKIKKLRLALVAMAACLAIVVTYSALTTSNTISTKESAATLAKVIAQNNELQKRFSELEGLQQFTYVGAVHFKLSVQALDKAIQLAYLEGKSSEYKINLWLQRKAVIEVMLDKANKPTVTII
jgi:hypothetical protein